MESNKDPSDVLASSEVDVNVTTQSSANQGEVPGGKAAKRGRCSMHVYTYVLPLQCIENITLPENDNFYRLLSVSTVNC